MPDRRTVGRTQFARRDADKRDMTGHLPSHLPPDGTPGDLTAEDLDALARSPLFAGCTAGQRDLVRGFAFATHLAHGAILLQPGEPNHHVYVLVEGQLAAFLDAEQQKRVARFVPGDGLGEHALVGPEGGTVYVAAQWPARLVALEARRLRTVMEAVPRIALNALDMLTARLRAANLRHDPRETTAGIGFMASHDAVTGLYNRRWMATAYPAELARAAHDGEPLCLALIDVDRFDRLNQALGRVAGDAILRQLADLTRNLLPSLDMLARAAGDRFAVLVPASLSETLAMCERLRANVGGRQFALRGSLGTQITLSIGVAPAQGDFEATLARAQAALARAKERGCNTVEPPPG
ncbi:MAG: GGDEF domain-containing protein [Alcaligenaceae bacterium]|nr:GGDEF domain-containing protein [Alcaligenaceae bacterium SAGV5]MPS51216.1 GGDEF domain-containing protein [Alcaligenaceae bacterium SAGV3]MPT57287.1 GGDEF domain-containing protein [Alcaligenaceae bacterium]